VDPGVEMNAFDYSIIAFLNQFVGRFPLFDKVVIYVEGTTFFRGGLLVALLWWAWFKEQEDDQNRVARQGIVASVLAAGFSIVLARVITLALPFRVRPIGDPTNGFHFPPATINWEAWSAFPSDHAILFATLTTGLFLVSVPLGWLALLDTLFVVCLPRIYLGIHYPTDTLAGLAIGASVSLLANRPAFRNRVGDAALGWMKRHPGSFYAAFFLFSFELAGMFSVVHDILAHFIKVLRT
jgi:membrane-associated phospholipid phosphatase